MSLLLKRNALDSGMRVRARAHTHTHERSSLCSSKVPMMLILMPLLLVMSRKNIYTNDSFVCSFLPLKSLKLIRPSELNVK